MSPNFNRPNDLSLRTIWSDAIGFSGSKSGTLSLTMTQCTQTEKEPIMDAIETKTINGIPYKFAERIADNHETWKESATIDEDAERVGDRFKGLTLNDRKAVAFLIWRARQCDAIAHDWQAAVMAAWMRKGALYEAAEAKRLQRKAEAAEQARRIAAALDDSCPEILPVKDEIKKHDAARAAEQGDED